MKTIHLYKFDNEEGKQQLKAFTGIAINFFGSTRYLHGKIHNENGPARIWNDKSCKEYWLYGKCIKTCPGAFSYSDEDFFKSSEYKAWLLLKNLLIIKSVDV